MKLNTNGKSNIISQKPLLLLGIISTILLVSSAVNIFYSSRLLFEDSIYTFTPLYFWASIIISYLSGIFIVYNGDKYNDKTLTIFGIVILIITNIVLLNLHLFRHYTLLLIRGDSGTYVGFVRDIVQTGSFDNPQVPLRDNFYPFIFIYIAVWSYFSQLGPVILIQIIPSILYIIYIIFIYYWVKNIYNNFKYIIYCILFTTPLYFAWFSTTFYAEYLCLLLIPLILYLFIKEITDNKFSLLIIIAFTAIALFHPIIASFVIIYRIIYIIYITIFEKHDKNTLFKMIYTSIILVMIFGFWNINQLSILKNFGELINNFLLGGLHTTFQSSTYYISTLGLFETIKILITMNSDEVILYSLTLIAIVNYIRTRRLNKTLSVILMLITATGTYILFFMITRIHNAYRLINLDFNLIFCIPIIAYYLASKKLTKTLDKRVIFLILIMLSTTTISLYQSPYTTYPNDYAAKSELQGMKWLIDHNTKYLVTTSIESPTERYSHYLYGYNSEISLKLSDNWRISPNHFNITRSLIKSDNALLFIPENDYITYTTTWKFTNRFTEADFIRIQDSTDIIFSSDGFSVSYLYIK